MAVTMAVGRPLRHHQGFTLLALLALMSTAMLALAVAGPRWAEDRRREQEKELLRIGRVYAQAIARYRDVSPAGGPRYPARLEDLLRDTRFAGTQRHLRALYPDPVNSQGAWGLVRNERGEILGVHSQSTLEPFSPEAGPAAAPAGPGTAGPAPARRYADWLFLATIAP